VIAAARHNDELKTNASTKMSLLGPELCAENIKKRYCLIIDNYMLSQEVFVFIGTGLDCSPYYAFHRPCGHEEELASFVSYEFSPRWESRESEWE
jgi:hypothetical protein